MKKLHMSTHNDSGLLITFCGLDGSGKTTMIRRLTADLELHYPLLLTKQPTSFVRNSDIFRNYMDCPDHTDYDYRSLSLLAASDRLQHTQHVIRPALEQGTIVISDRYIYSCLANLRARGFTHDHWLYEIARPLVKPDIAFFLDVPVETAVARVRNRPEEKERYIDMDLQYRLRKEYRAICRANHGVFLSTLSSEDDTYTQIKTTIERMLLL